MFSPAGKHESGTKSGGGENWLLRSQFTLKWNIYMHINVKKSSVPVRWCYLWLCRSAGPGMWGRPSPSGQPWQQSSNIPNTDIFHLTISEVCSHWSLDSVLDHTPTGKLHHPTPPPYFQQIGARNCNENFICFFLFHLPPSETCKTLRLSNKKPWISQSYLMGDPCLKGTSWGPFQLELFYAPMILT